MVLQFESAYCGPDVKTTGLAPRHGAEIANPFLHCNFGFHPRAVPGFRISRVEPRLLFEVTATAIFNGSFGVAVFRIAIGFVAFDAAGFMLSVRHTVVSVFDIHAAAFFLGVGMTGFFVATDALGYFFDARVFVGVMAILTAFRVLRLNVRAVIEVFDHSPSVVLSPVRTFFRIAQANNARWAGLACAGGRRLGRLLSWRGCRSRGRCWRRRRHDHRL